MKLITGKINMDAVDQKRIFKGKKGNYLNIVLIPTPNSQYSDYMIKQQTEKDEDSIILGNASEFTPNPEQKEPDEKDDLPF